MYLSLTFRLYYGNLFFQDKLARLNAAITEGLKLQREQEEEEEEEESSSAVVATAVVTLPPPTQQVVVEKKWVGQVPLSVVEEEVKTIIDELIKGGGSAGGGGVLRDTPPRGGVATTEEDDVTITLPTTTAAATTATPTTTTTTTTATTPAVEEQTTTKLATTDATDTENDVVSGAKDVGTKTSEHPSSHFRPRPASNWSAHIEEDEFFPMPKSNLMPKDSSLGIMLTPGNGGGGGLLLQLPQKPLPKREESKHYSTFGLYLTKPIILLVWVNGWRI